MACKFSIGDRVRRHPDIGTWRSKRDNLGTITNVRADKSIGTPSGIQWMCTVRWDGNKTTEIRAEHHFELVDGRTEAEQEAECIFCGGIDSFFLVDRTKRLGVCSQCAPIRWRSKAKT